MKHEGAKNDTDIRMDEMGHSKPVKPFVGCIVWDELHDIKGIVLKVNKKSVSGLIIEGSTDSTYRYCNFVKVKTSKGFKYAAKKPLSMLGYVDKERLQEAIDKVDTDEWFGSGEYSPG